MTAKAARGLSEAVRGLSLSSQLCRHAAPRHRIHTPPPPTTSIRSMASEAPLPTAFDASGRLPIWMPTAKVPVTVYGFPSYEPLRLEEWSVQHLHVPLRRDILHLAVVFEGDNTRQGTASSKTRWEVRGSHRKVHPQKGTGQARAGTRQSPLRKGGGKSFGPKPRDFGTKMNRKVYDLAWRTALSYRYRRGELTVCEDGMDLQLPAGYDKLFALSGTKEVEQGFREKWLMQILRWNEWGRSHGRVTFITEKQRPNLFSTINPMPREGRALDLADVDVKDLLETGRIVIERAALKGMIEAHQSDLVTFVFNAGVQTEKTPEIGKILVG